MCIITCITLPMACDIPLTAVKLGPNSLSGTWRVTLLASNVTSLSSSSGATAAGAMAEDFVCSWAKTCWSLVPGTDARKSSSSCNVMSHSVIKNLNKFNNMTFNHNLIFIYLIGIILMKSCFDSNIRIIKIIN